MPTTTGGAFLQFSVFQPNLEINRYRPRSLRQPSVWPEVLLRPSVPRLQGLVGFLNFETRKQVATPLFSIQVSGYEQSDRKICLIVSRPWQLHIRSCCPYAQANIMVKKPCAGLPEHGHRNCRGRAGPP